MNTTEQKTTFSFIDANRKRVTVEAEITYRNGYKELTFSGDYGNGLGQIVDHIKPANEAQTKLVELWSKYHLNGMTAGTPKQNEALNSPEFEAFKIQCADIVRKAKEVERIATGTLKQYAEFVGYKVDDKLFCSLMMKQDFELLQAYWNKKPNAKFLTLGKIFRSTDIQHPKFAYNSSVHPKVILSAFGDDFSVKKEFLKDQKLEPDTNYLYNNKPYSYGSAWLHVELPEDIEDQLTELSEAIEEYEEERKGEPLSDLSDSDLVALIEEQTNFSDRDAELCAALVRMFDLSENDLGDIEIDENRVTVQGTEYIAGDDSEMDEEVTEYIKDSLWAFRAEFIAGATDIPVEAIEALCEKCESGNDGLLRIVEKTCGLEYFVELAVSADGRAHFLNRYDGGEEEQSINGTTYYAYRQ